MLTVITFKWKSPRYRIQYAAHHVNVVEAMIRRNYDGDLRFVCVTDDPEGVTGETFPLWDDCNHLHNAGGMNLPSCYRRLKLFDPATQRALGIGKGDRFVQIDLDVVICGELNSLWDRKESFVGWAVKGAYHPRVFNGSMWMVRAGAEAHVWNTFDPETSPAAARAARYLGSDQAWMSLCLQGRAGWTDADGVYSYPIALRRLPEPPEDCRVAIFHGFGKPWAPSMPQWVKDRFRISGSGRCLILGYGDDVWDEAEQALRGERFDGVIASPEAAEMWPEPVTAVARSDEEAESLATMLGFDEVRFCGRSIGVAA